MSDKIQEHGLIESKSIKAFKNDLIVTLPYFPNTKETRQSLQQQHISSVLFHYLHWASRLIPDRKRKVTVEPYLFFDYRWQEHESDVYRLLDKARNGEDLTEHLSNKVKTRGYTTKENILAQNDSWLDKDQLLNTKGFFHLHLKKGKQNKGNVVLFARITRDEFKAIGLFDHGVFQKLQDGQISPERRRMLAIYEDLIYREIGPNKAYMSNPITMSGHPLHFNTMTGDYWRVIEEIDPKISDSTFINDVLFNGSSFTVPKKPKLKWCLYGLDLGLYESKTQVFFAFRKGYL